MSLKSYCLQVKFIAIFLSLFALTLAAADKTKTEKIGDILQLAIPLSGAAYSISIGDYNGTWQLAKTYASTAAATQILKYTIREERPHQPEDAKGHTFPSGHTSSAFAGASFIQKRYGWEAGAPAYLLASFVGYSRVHARKHNWLDVLAAAGLGVGFGYYFTDKYIEDKNMHITLDADTKGLYLGASFAF